MNLLLDVDKSPAEILMDRERNETVLKFVNTLYPMERKVVMLLVYEGMSATDTARKMKRSTARIYQLFKMARRKLRYRGKEAWGEIYDPGVTATRPYDYERGDRNFSDHLLWRLKCIYWYRNSGKPRGPGDSCPSSKHVTRQ